MDRTVRCDGGGGPRIWWISRFACQRENSGSECDILGCLLQDMDQIGMKIISIFSIFFFLLLLGKELRCKNIFYGMYVVRSKFFFLGNAHFRIQNFLSPPKLLSGSVNRTAVPGPKAIYHRVLSIRWLPVGRRLVCVAANWLAFAIGWLEAGLACRYFFIVKCAPGLFLI